MLTILDEFRDTLSGIILKSLNKRIIIYGDGYSGRFVRWYAKYYHGMEPAYTISTGLSYGLDYENTPLMPWSFEYQYKDMRDCVVWVTVPCTDVLKKRLESYGYVENETYFAICEAIYGDDLYWPEPTETDIYHVRKTGQRDIQLIEWLEWKYGCNFITPVMSEKMVDIGPYGNGHRVSTQREVFSILDECHCRPKENDAILDIGSGKGGAVLSFLDFGFEKVGGVEFEKGLYDVAVDNFNRIGIDCVEWINGDATKLTEELDRYNWFYFADPFMRELCIPIINNISESIKRKPRKIRIVYINNKIKDIVAATDNIRIVKEIWAPTRNHIVGYYESY